MVNVWYMTPFDGDKRLGYIHNEYCRIIPNSEDYIAILDPDVLFLHPHQQRWIEEVLEYDNGAHDLLGCMTNRIGVPQQVAKSVSVTWERKKGQVVETEFIEHEETMFDLKDMHMHHMYAHLIHDKRRYEIEDTHLIAGFCMIFKKSLWDRIKFENSIQFDMKFCDKVMRSGGKIGIMKGIYLYHSYRQGSDNPTKDKKHLL